jgi:hypothetical protein
MLKSPTDESISFVDDDELMEREIEAQICQRFIRLSCEKIVKARQERGGSKLHRNLLVVQLLRKARTDTKRLPYECAHLINRPSAVRAALLTPSSSYERNTKRSKAIDIPSENNRNSVEMPLSSLLPESPMPLSANMLELLPPPPPALEPLECIVEDAVEITGSALKLAFVSPRFLLTGAEKEDAIEEGTDIVASLPREVHFQLATLDSHVEMPILVIVEESSNGNTEEPTGNTASNTEDVFEDEDDAKPPQMFCCSAATEESDQGDIEQDENAAGEQSNRKRSAIAFLLTADIAEKRQCCESDEECDGEISLLKMPSSCANDGDSDSGIDVEAISAENVVPSSAEVPFLQRAKSVPNMYKMDDLMKAPVM